MAFSVNDDSNAEPPVCDEVTLSLSSCDKHTVFFKATRHPTPELVFHAAVCIHLILVSFHVNVLTTLYQKALFFSRVGFYESSRAKKAGFFPPYGTGIVKVFVKMITPQSFKDIKADR